MFCRLFIKPEMAIMTPIEIFEAKRELMNKVEKCPDCNCPHRDGNGTGISLGVMILANTPPRCLIKEDWGILTRK